MSAAVQPAEPLSAEARKAQLDQVVTGWVRDGWSIQSRTDYSAVVAKGKKPNHILHLILTLLTAGVWAVVWIILAITKREQRRTVTVDEHGRATSY